MNARVVDRLGKLHPSDRAWILHQLSPRERSALMDIASADTALPIKGPATAAPDTTKVAASPAAEVDHVAETRRADVGRVVEVLQWEPAWVVAALMSIESWPWSASALQSMPATLRADVTDLMRRPLNPTAAMRERLIAYFVDALQDVGNRPMPSRWQSLVRRAEAVLVRKRLVLGS